ncbi:sensor histidine kinase [Massilia soli]|uniref:sensor histidine kinase n=1 Tax=Massilia soli TaxID=2792854 RepID=UPI001CBAEDEC|nr:ATP-binding protein [Massilia soli]
MWANFALSAALITWFVGRMSSTLRDRDAQLARAREQQLRNDRIVALGTQAASAAHEIGTPLATIAVIAGELRHEMDRDPSLVAFRDDIAAIETQIAACKTSLDRLGKHASADAGPNASALQVDAWLARFIEGWRLRHPAARLDLAIPRSGAVIANTSAVGQILLTLLDNAARAAAPGDTGIAVSLAVDVGFATIEVRDRGPGISAELLKRLGHDQVASQNGGQGMGLMLAFATARQIGATLRLSSPAAGGTLAALSVPLA